MRAGKRVFNPDASTNASQLATPPAPDSAWSITLILRERDCFFSLHVSRKHKDRLRFRSETNFIVKTMRSTPSLFRKSSLIAGSARAEQRTSNKFSMNSVSSASRGSWKRYCCRCVSRLLLDESSVPTERTFRIASTPSSSPSCRRLRVLSWSKIARSSAA